jgi:hypothetical protein
MPCPYNAAFVGGGHGRDKSRPYGRDMPTTPRRAAHPSTGGEFDRESNTALSGTIGYPLNLRALRRAETKRSLRREPIFGRSNSAEI